MPGINETVTPAVRCGSTPTTTPCFLLTCTTRRPDDKQQTPSARQMRRAFYLAGAG